MNQIPALIEQKNYDQLYHHCQQLEIQNVTDESINLSQLYPILLATCVLDNDLQTARHVRKRILWSNANTPEIDAVWAVIVALIKKSYPEVYHRLDQYAWSEIMQPLILDIKELTRKRMLDLVSRIYASIELNQALAYFGMGEEQLLKELAAKGWNYNEATRVLYPLKPAPQSRLTSSNQQFEKLADIVLNLEKF